MENGCFDNKNWDKPSNLRRVYGAENEDTTPATVTAAATETAAAGAGDSGGGVHDASNSNGGSNGDSGSGGKGRWMENGCFDNKNWDKPSNLRRVYGAENEDTTPATVTAAATETAAAGARDGGGGV
eukprot:g15389.t1